MLQLLLCPYWNFICFMPAVLLCLVDGNLRFEEQLIFRWLTTTVFLHRPGFRRVGTEWIVSFKKLGFYSWGHKYRIFWSCIFGLCWSCSIYRVNLLLITLIFRLYSWGFTLIMGKWRIGNKSEQWANFCLNYERIVLWLPIL